MSAQMGCYVFICTQVDTVCVRNQCVHVRDFFFWAACMLVCVCVCECFRVLLSGKHTGR